jgi:DNA processing protein
MAECPPRVPSGQPPSACDSCRARADLLASVSARIDRHRRDRHRLQALLALEDSELRLALGLPSEEGAQASARTDFPTQASGQAPALCRHHPDYPAALRALAAPPSVVHLAGDPERALELLRMPAVAIVGTRAPSDYGSEVAHAMAAGLASTGICVLSGMAMGIDVAAHTGAMSVAGATLAALPGGVDVAYPASRRALHRRLAAESAVIAELPPGTKPRSWCFVARNRLIAALAGVTVVIEARERSGALITAGLARDLGHAVAAVPGPVTASRSDGTNALIHEGAHLVRDAQDVLDLLYGVGGPTRVVSPSGAAPTLEPMLAWLLDLVRDGADTADALTRRGMSLDDALTGLAQLELCGFLRRGLSGRYVPVRR